MCPDPIVIHGVINGPKQNGPNLKWVYNCGQYNLEIYKWSSSCGPNFVIFKSSRQVAEMLPTPAPLRAACAVRLSTGGLLTDLTRIR